MVTMFCGPGEGRNTADLGGGVAASGVAGEARATRGETVRWLSSVAAGCVLPGSGAWASLRAGRGSTRAASHLAWLGRTVREPSMTSGVIALGCMIRMVTGRLAKKPPWD